MVTVAEVPKGYKKTEVGIIPEDWEAEPMGSFLEFKNGLNKAKEFFGKGTPIVNYMDVFSNAGLLCSDIEGKVTLTSDEIRNYQVKKGDVFFTRTSETVDEIGMSSVMLEDIKDAVFSGFVLRGRPTNDSFHLMYKKYCFRFEKVRKQICSTSSYTTRALTNGRLLSKVFIAVPPQQEEQEFIARTLSDIDILIIRLEELIAKKRNVKQGAMHELLTGKKRLPGFRGEWGRKKMGEIGKPFGGLSGKTKRDFENGTHPYIPFLNVMNNPIIDVNFFDYFNIKSGERQNTAQKGDLFFNGSSETPEEVGMCSVLMDDIPNLYLNSFCFGFRLNKDLDTDGLYLSYFFRSHAGRQLIFFLAQGATRHNLSKNNFLKLEIPYPRPEEQSAIAQVFSDMDAEIEELEQKLNKYKMIMQGMMQELLTGKTRLI